MIRWFPIVILIMKRIVIAICTLIHVSVFAQDNPTALAKPIVDEGKRLYKSEMASWYGTDLFLAKYKDQDNIGGYFSYSDNNLAKCIFFSKAEQPKAIGTIIFDSTYDTETATVDLTERDLTPIENDLCRIRKLAYAIIISDTMFKSYQNTSLNLIPLINGDKKKVYVLTGPSQNGVVIFGNDYLLEFDKDNQVISKKALHQNLIPIKYGEETGQDGKVEGAMHTHLPETGDFITATDICTLMLYEKFAKWKRYNVVSEKYLNIWDCLTDTLIVIPMSTLEKINKDKSKND